MPLASRLARVSSSRCLRRSGSRLPGRWLSAPRARREANEVGWWVAGRGQKDLGIGSKRRGGEESPAEPRFYFGLR